MPVRPRRVAALAALPTVIMTGVGVAAAASPSEPSSAPAATTPAYIGSAYAIRAQLSLAGGAVLDQLLPDVVKFPTGGDRSVLELPTELSETATLKVLNANSAVKNNVLRSNARTAGLGVLTDLVTAAVLNADCTAEQEKVTGDAQVTDLAIAGIKVPVDPGPNFKVEIPQELKPFLSGGIWVDRQDKLKDGTLRVRALQVRLVIDPLGLQSALESLVAEVRAAAQKVVAVVEQITGEALETIAAKERAARGLLPAAPGSHGTGVARSGTASARDEPRAEYAARRQEQAPRPDREAVARGRQAAEPQRPAVERRASAAATGSGAVAAESPREPEAGVVRTAKADRAAVAREQAPRHAQPAADSPAHEAPGAGVERKRDGAQQQVPAEQPADMAAQPAAEPAAAHVEGERAQAEQTQAEQTQAEQTQAEQTQAEQTQAEQTQAEQTQAEQTQAEQTQAEQTQAEQTQAEQTQAEQTQARPAQARPAQAAAQARSAPAAQDPARQSTRPVAPAAEDPEDDEQVGGTLGLQVIVSQVTCKGAKVVQVREAPPAPPEEEESELPRTGGDGIGALNLGAAGLGLLLAGTAAVYVTRRRGRHAR